MLPTPREHTHHKSLWEQQGERIKQLGKYINGCEKLWDFLAKASVPLTQEEDSEVRAVKKENEETCVHNLFLYSW